MPGEVPGNFVYTQRGFADYFLHFLRSKATVDEPHSLSGIVPDFLDHAIPD